MRVRARNAALAAGLFAAIYLAALFTVRRVPDAIVAALGGPRGIDREGGLIVRYRPPDGVDPARIQRSIARRMVVDRVGAALQIQVPGVSEAEAGDLIAMLTRGGLEFREVFDDLSLARAPHGRPGDPDYVSPGVRVAIDQWIPDSESGNDARHTSAYLLGRRPADLATAIGRLESAGWSPPPHSAIMIERVAPRDDEPGEHWRTYFVGDEVLLDGDSVAGAQASHDAYTGRPVVMLEFDRAGAERFGDITARIVGRKLATIIGGEVRSAPIINTPIRGGRAEISMGGLDVAGQEREAAATAAALQVGALPRGGRIDDQRFIAPPDLAGVLALARGLIGLVGGALIGAAIGLAVRIARPVWRPGPRRRAGRGAGRRFTVTLLAPVALIALGQLDLPGIDAAALGFAARRGGIPGVGASILQLGVGPIITAFLAVELAMLVVPRWRRLRHQPAARIRSGRWVAILGVGFALLQSHIAVGFLSSLARDRPEVFEPGAVMRLAATLAMPAGTLLLVIVAGVIREHGLGNGYGAVVVSAWALSLLDVVLEHVVFQPSAAGVLGLVTLAAIAGATIAVLRMRIADDGAAPLRLPASGLAPLNSVAGVAALWSLAGAIAWLGVGSLLAAPAVLRAPGLAGQLVLLLALVPAWSYAFSRPSIVAGFAPRAELAPPTAAAWRRATLLTLVFLLIIAAASRIAALSDAVAGALGDAVSVMMLAAVALDALDDLRARRGALVVAWPLHQAQHAELVRCALARAGIECHLSASHLRTLLAFFGPYVPIDVLVPAASADAARRTIAALFDASPVEAFD